MDKISLALTALLTLTMVAIIAPNVLALNYGRILRNVAIWLAVIVLLALIYQNFGPGKNAALPYLPAGASHEEPHQPASDNPPDKDTGDEGYTPPRE